MGMGTRAHINYLKRTAGFFKLYSTLYEILNNVLESSINYTERASSLKAIKKVLKKDSPKLSKDIEEIDKKNIELEGMIKNFSEEESLVKEIFFVIYINAFITYLSDAMLEIFMKHPVLLSGRLVPLSKIIEEDLDDIVREEAEIAVFAKTRQGFRGTVKFYKKFLNITVIKDKVDIDKISKIIEVRNLLVHNHGIITAKFLEKTGYKFKIGNTVKITEEYFDYIYKKFNDIVDTVETQIIERYINKK